MEKDFLLESFDEFVTNEKAKALKEDDNAPGSKVELKDGTFGTVQSYDDVEGVYIILTDDGSTLEVTDDELIKEGVMLEADVKDKNSLKGFIYAMYKEAFKDKFDEAKADDVIDGLIKKYGDDWGAMVGAAKNSLG